VTDSFGGDMASTQELLSNPVSVGVWNIDPHRSTIGFKANSMWALAPVNGRFTKFNGDGAKSRTPKRFSAASISTPHRSTPR